MPAYFALVIPSAGAERRSRGILVFLATHSLCYIVRSADEGAQQPPMFERYTEKARRVIFFARYEAAVFGSPYIETEHLLLGLLREDQQIRRRLSHSGDPLSDVRKKVEARSGMGEKISTSVDLPLSLGGRRVLSFAAEESERLRDKHIGTEHLLLGLLRVKDSFAAEILNGYGIVRDDSRDQTSTPHKRSPEDFYCPRCAESVPDPLTCGDCSAVICRQCGTPLETPDDLAMG